MILGEFTIMIELEKVSLKHLCILPDCGEVSAIKEDKLWLSEWCLSCEWFSCEWWEHIIL